MITRHSLPSIILVSIKSVRSGLTFNHHVRRLDVKFPDTGNICGSREAFSPAAASKVWSKVSIFSSGTPLSLEKTLYIRLGEHERVGRILGLLHHFRQMLMDILNDLVITVFPSVSSIR